MYDQLLFDKYPIGKEFYNSQNYRIESVTSHIMGKWVSSNSDWYGILTVPVIPDLKYFLRKTNIHSLWGKHSKYVSNKNDDTHTLIAGIWPEDYFVYCINGGYSPNDYINFLDDLVVDYLSNTTRMIRRKDKTGLLIYSYESATMDDSRLEMAYTIDLANQYLDWDKPKNRRGSKEFIEVARYVDWKAACNEDNE